MMKQYLKLWLILILFTLFITPAALAESPSRDFLLSQSIGKDWQISSSYLEGDWAILSLKASDNSQMALAHWDGTAWQIALPHTTEYNDWLNQLPTSLVTPTARPFLQATDTDITANPPQLALPFPKGQTWRYLGGPNGSPKRKAVDFGPLSFNEPTNPYGIYTGREREVTAAASGVVVDKDTHLLILRHEQGWETVYYSLAASSIQHRLGDYVAQGELLGLASDETAPEQTVHVRFWVRHNGADQPIAGLTLSGWTIYPDNSYQSGDLAGRIVYQEQLEKIDCQTVKQFRFDPATCHLTHYAEALLRVSPTVTRLPRNGSGSTTLDLLNVHDLSRIEFHLNNGVEDYFTPFFEVVNVSLGTLFEHSLPTPSNPVHVPERDSLSSVLTFTATIDPPFSGSGSLLNIEWESLTAGETELILSQVHLFNSQGQPIPVTLQDGALQVLPNFLVEGRLQLPNGYALPHVQINWNNKTVPLDHEGRFKIEATGDYTFTITAPQCLSVQVSGRQANLGNIQLLSGEVTGDDRINVFDLAYLGSRYNQTDSTADLNGDGIVNIYDLALSASNYGKQGPLMLGQ